MTEQQIQEFTALLEIVRVRAGEVLDGYRSIFGKQDNQFVSFAKVEDETIYYEGQEPWQYGDRQSLELPLRCLGTDDGHLEGLRQAKQAREQAAIAAREAKSVADARVAQDRELAELARLQAKYGGRQEG